MCCASEMSSWLLIPSSSSWIMACRSGRAARRRRPSSSNWRLAGCAPFTAGRARRPLRRPPGGRPVGPEGGDDLVEATLAGPSQMFPEKVLKGAYKRRAPSNQPKRIRLSAVSTITPSIGRRLQPSNSTSFWLVIWNSTPSAGWICAGYWVKPGHEAYQPVWKDALWNVVAAVGKMLVQDAGDLCNPQNAGKAAETLSSGDWGNHGLQVSRGNVSYIYKYPLQARPARISAAHHLDDQFR